MAEQRKAYALRLDPALWAAVERCATASLRSANAEIECLLREALERRGVKLAPPQARKRGRPPKETNDE
ncbi:toxin-antitoxin system HicB family antitoxin [Sphingomonas ginkgonis]|uniref:Toxin-antitoxin system HicB family antitoxin n=1 Tax=Sphingomonas ginkgonis TaxID=2315330 RepID=A0A3R9WR73_9SPHN|nr:toxin-antitoxin system HicB family antitoxin [Sphingomonas ginkgonis]RST29850.1 toxin-antitoxin system HicB family antitoxin [Sphingomonas ginkgonis]